jgi:hypothetical protein
MFWLKVVWVHKSKWCDKSKLDCQKECFKNLFYKATKKYNPIRWGVITIKWANGDKGLKDCNPFCGHFHFLLRCNLLQYATKNTYKFLNTSHFCIIFSWITNHFLKVYGFYQIFCFVLKIYQIVWKYVNYLMLYFIVS